MNFTESRRQVPVDADNKRDTRDARHRAADAACVTHSYKYRGKHSQEADLQCDRADSDGMKHAALRIEIGCGHQRENGKGACNIHESDERSSAKHGSRQCATWIAHFFAHGRDELESGEGESNLRPEGARVP